MFEFNDEDMDKILEYDFNDEQMEFITKELPYMIGNYSGYKIRAGSKVTVDRKQVGNYTFYSTVLSKKGKENKKVQANRSLKFINCEPPKAEHTNIIVKRLFEDWFDNKNDRYNPIPQIAIMDYEYVNENAENFTALADFRDEYKNNDFDNFELTNPMENKFDFDEDLGF